MTNNDCGILEIRYYYLPKMDGTFSIMKRIIRKPLDAYEVLIVPSKDDAVRVVEELNDDRIDAEENEKLF